jgi:hypothetical protein
MNRYYLFSFGCLLCLVLFASCQQQEPPAEKEIVLDFGPNYNHEAFVYFQDLIWKDSLSVGDKRNFWRALDTLALHPSDGYMSRLPFAQELAMVHRLYGGTGNQARIAVPDVFNNEFKATEHSSDEEYDKVLLSCIDPKKLVKFVFTTHYRSEDDVILNALLYRQCRLRRKGLAPTLVLPDSLLQDDQKYLLKYSGYPNEEAIARLYGLITNPALPNIHEGYAQIRILGTYGQAATEKIYRYVMDSLAVVPNSENTKSLMLSHLLQRANVDLPEAAQKALVDFLMQEAVFCGPFDNQKHTIASINSTITGADTWASLNIVGIYEDTMANNKMMREMVAKIRADNEKAEREREKRRKK